VRKPVRAIKKLPQVGQEPVEAVESRPISPDGLYNTRNGLERKDISEKAIIIWPKNSCEAGIGGYRGSRAKAQLPQIANRRRIGLGDVK
jgi:hypothetical protein